LSGWAVSRRVDLTVVGPEAPLAAGIVDRFQGQGPPRLRSHRRSRPNRVVQSLREGAHAWRRGSHGGLPGLPGSGGGGRAHPGTGAPVVVKASGLAAGKGAIVCDTVEAACQAARHMLEDLRFGEAGRQVVVEECMRGEELSVFALTDGRSVLTLLPSQDHKRLGEGDVGPNTGGMGAYAPVSLATADLMEEVEARILLPTLQAMEMEGSPFQGLLYAGSCSRRKVRRWWSSTAGSGIPRPRRSFPSWRAPSWSSWPPSPRGDPWPARTSVGVMEGPSPPFWLRGGIRRATRRARPSSCPRSRVVIPTFSSSTPVPHARRRAS
jgi:hypothetical protein